MSKTESVAPTFRFVAYGSKNARVQQRVVGFKIERRAGN